MDSGNLPTRKWWNPERWAVTWNTLVSLKCCTDSTGWDQNWVPWPSSRVLEWSESFTSFVSILSSRLGFSKLYGWICGLCWKPHLLNWDLNQMSCLQAQFIGLLPSLFLGSPSSLCSCGMSCMENSFGSHTHGTQPCTAPPRCSALVPMISTRNDSADMELGSLWLPILPTGQRFSKPCQKQGSVVL